MTLDIYVTARGLGVVSSEAVVCACCQHYGFMWVMQGGRSWCIQCAPTRPDELVYIQRNASH